MKKYVFLFFITPMIALSAGSEKSNCTAGVNTKWNTIGCNSILGIISNEGVFTDYSKTNSSSLFWPKGGTTTAIYSSGFIMAGIHRPSRGIRTAVNMYKKEFQSGKLIGIFNTTTNDPSAADNPSNLRYRLYKITKGDSYGSGNPDYDEWPGDLGAPYTDINKNGKWDRGIDTPLNYGHQQLWCVSNDADPVLHESAGKTKPMGIEMQSTFFAFDLPGFYDNTVFLRFKIINKSDADYDSVFTGYWHDIDLGWASDDLVGIDSLLNLFYVYNGSEIDLGNGGFGPVGYGERPPSNGFVLLQGPMVKTNSAADTALFEGIPRIGYKNLSPSASAMFIVGSPYHTDPPLGAVEFSRQLMNNFNGKIGFSGQPIINPQTGEPIKFLFPGDPVTGTGWTSAVSGITPQDVRGLFSAGPFSLSKGDTQEIIFAYTIARDTGRLAGITKLRNYASSINQFYKHNFLPDQLTRTAPRYSAEQSDIKWPSTEVGTLSDTMVYVIENHGTETLSLKQQLAETSRFSVIPSNGQKIQIGGWQKKEIKIIFKPIEVGSATDMITFTTNDPETPVKSLQLTGNGYKIEKAVSGKIYTTNSGTLYSIVLSSGTAVAVCPISNYVGIAVQPASKELYGIDNYTMYRVSAGANSSVPAGPGPSITPDYGFFFTSDSTISFGKGTLIVSFNLKSRIIDTLMTLPSDLQVQSLAMNPLTGDYWIVKKKIIPPEDELFRANIKLKTVALVGRTFIGSRISSMLFDKEGKLYASAKQGTNSSLIIIDTATAAGTLIGTMGAGTFSSLTMSLDAVAGVQLNDKSLPASFTLGQNYPNPFNPATTFSYELPEAVRVRLIIYDALGREVAELVDERNNAGRYSVQWNASAMPSGIYFYRINAGQFQETRRMILMK